MESKFWELELDGHSTVVVDAQRERVQLRLGTFERMSGRDPRRTQKGD